MKKVLSLLSLCSFVVLQAASIGSDYNKVIDSELRIQSDDSGLVESPISFDDSLDTEVIIALEKPIEINGKKVGEVTETIGQLQFKYNNMRVLIEMLSPFIHEHDKNHMRAILKYSPEDKKSLIDLARDKMEKHGNKDKRWEAPNNAVQNFTFLKSLI